MPPRKRKKPCDIDREIRINELKRKIEETTGHEFSDDGPEQAPPEVEEKFLERVLDFESTESTTHAKQIEAAGATLPAPETLSEAQVHEKIWEVIRVLATRHVYLHNTNHLSDRELYSHLCARSLREEVPDFPPGSGWNSHIDIIGSGSEEDIALMLKYYYDEKERRDWKRRWPKDEMPPHVDPPYDRDRFLPEAVYPGVPSRETLPRREPRNRDGARPRTGLRHPPERRRAPRRSSPQRRG